MQDENKSIKKGRGRPKKDAPVRPKRPKKGAPMKPEARKLLATRITIERGMLERYFAGSIEAFAQFLHNQYQSFCAEQNNAKEGCNDND